MMKEKRQSATTQFTQSKSYTELARAIFLHFSKSIKPTAVAVLDGLGLWHIYPQNKISISVKNFETRRSVSRIAVLCAKNTRSEVMSELKNFADIIALKLESIDLYERLQRAQFIAKSREKYSDREMRQFRAKLNKEMVAKIDLFGKYSHDLKTPFSMLISGVENMIVHDDSLPAKVRLQLEAIRAQIHNVLRTAGQSLDAARILTGRNKATLIPYNFSEYVKQVVAAYTIVFESYGIRMESEIQNDIPGEIDPLQMEKVLNNILNNALKYSIPGGYVHVDLHVSGRKIFVTVTDNGVGFVADGAHESRRLKDINPWIFSSHGYGLRIVRELLRANRGKFKLTAEKGIGTRAQITLPAIPELNSVVHSLRSHSFQMTLREVEQLASERTQLSRRFK